MKSIDAYQQLKSLGHPIIRTQDAMACLQITKSHASHLLARLAQSGNIVRLGWGLWSLTTTLDPLLLPEYLTWPNPSYISLQTALYFHGIISQIPQIVFAVTLGRSRRYQTPFGTISVHTIQPGFFSHYDCLPPHFLKLATPAKSLMDYLYLSTTQSAYFGTLPEVDLSAVDSAQCHGLLDKITNERKRKQVEKKLLALENF